MIICCLSSGDMYLLSWVVIATSSFVSSLLCNSLADVFFETFVILSGTLLPIKSAIDSAVFWIAFFDAVFVASDVEFLGLSKRFWPYFWLKFYPCV